VRAADGSGATRADILAELARQALANPARPLRLGITGPSAAGKTTLADALSEVIPRMGVPVYRCEMDDFHRAGHRYRSSRQEWTGELYYREGYDYEALRDLVLVPCGPGGNRRCRLRLFSSYDDRTFAEEWTAVDPGGVLIVDGGLLLNPVLAPHLDFVVWLDVDEETVLRRAMTRDRAWAMDDAGNPLSAETIRNRYEAYHLPCHRLYVRETGGARRADVVVDNRDPSAPRIMGRQR
jgi:uridine kinase